MPKNSPTQRLGVLAGHLRSYEEVSEKCVHVSETSSRSVETGFRVAVLGAAGGIGQPLCLLLKSNPLVTELRLYDVANTAGVAADLSHINTRATVSAHSGPDALSGALYGAHLVVIPAGIPRKPGMTRDDLFNINAGIVKTLIEGVAKYCPDSWIAIISNPVNSTVPIAAEVLKREGALNPRRLFGVTTLDVVRANTFVGEAVHADPSTVNVPVIGGHAGKTILPILSAASHRPQASQDLLQKLTERIQDAGTEVVKAKAGAGSATLSMAYAAARFADSCLQAMSGKNGIVECSYVMSAVTDIPFFASPVLLGENGIEEYLPLPRMSLAEQSNFEAMSAELRASIQKGIDFVHHPPPSRK